MAIKLKRVYDSPNKSDGMRILVERLWPRGLSKDKANVDLWVKELAPSTSLRKWFDHDPKKWKEFRSCYFKEIGKLNEEVEGLLEHVRRSKVTFVFASREEKLDNAVALKEFTEKLL